jgi:hypothetical protein
MTKYVENMLNSFPLKFGKKDVAKMPARDNIFNLGTGAKLDTKRSEIIHTLVGKGLLFLCKRTRPNIQQAISVLCTRVKDPGSESSRLGKADESDEISEQVPMTYEWSTGTWTHPLQCIQTLKVTPAH